MEIFIDIKKKHFYILLAFVVFLGIGFAIASPLSTQQGHDDLWVKEISGKDTNSVQVSDNIEVFSGKDILIDGKSVLADINAGSGITIVRPNGANEVTISSVGSGALNYEKVSNTCLSMGYSCEVQCPSGKKILSGGCYYSGARTNFKTNGPSEDNTKWICVINAYRDLTVQAICGNVL